MRTTLALLTGAFLLGNGGFMLLAPAGWYETVPGVTGTGPFNPHFVRDIGAAYLAAGGAALWAGLRPRARPAALAGAGFLGLHALIHLAEWAAGHGLGHLSTDVPGVLLPPLILLWLGWPRSFKTMENGHAEMADPAAPRRL